MPDSWRAMSESETAAPATLLRQVSGSKFCASRRRSRLTTALPFSRNQLHYFRRSTLCSWLFPQSKTANERVGVISGAAAFGQLLQFLGVPATDHDIVNMHLGQEVTDDLVNMSPPFLLSQPSQRASADILLVCTFFVRKVRDLSRFGHAIDNQRGPKTRPESEEEHPAPPVTAYSLHRGIVDKFYRNAEGSAKVEAYPAWSQVKGLRNQLSEQDRSRHADGQYVIFPLRRQPFCAGDHLAGGQPTAGWKLQRLRVSSRKHLDVGSTDIDYEHLHRTALVQCCPMPCGATFALSTRCPRGLIGCRALDQRDGRITWP